MMNEMTEITEAIESNPQDFIVYYGEALLKNWGDNAAGESVEFWLSGDRFTHPFKGHRNSQRQPGGARFILMVVEVGDDNTPINQQAKDKIKAAMDGHMRGGAISKRCGILCKDPAFHQFLKYKSARLEPGQKHALSATIPHGMAKEMTDTKMACLEDAQKGEAFAKHFIYYWCCIHSRRELDYRIKAAQAWADLEADFIGWGASTFQQ